MPKSNQLVCANCKPMPNCCLVVEWLAQEALELKAFLLDGKITQVCFLVHTECELLIVSVVFNTTRLDGFFTVMTTNMSIFQQVFVLTSSYSH